MGFPSVRANVDGDWSVGVVVGGAVEEPMQAIGPCMRL